MIRITYANRLKVDASCAWNQRLKTLPLWRRMTPLQKAVLAVFVQAMEAQPEIFTRLKAEGAPIYFTSAYGEIGAMLRITDSIARNSLPVSPKDFQHSVLNAAIAYIAMKEGLHVPGYALSSGFASIDLAMHLASKRVGTGFDPSAIVIHAHEWADHTDSAEAEIFTLETTSTEGLYELISFDTHPETCSDVLDFDELSGTSLIPWMWSDAGISLQRRVRDAYGTEIRSEWKALT